MFPSIHDSVNQQVPPDSIGQAHSSGYGVTINHTLPLGRDPNCCSALRTVIGSSSPERSFLRGHKSSQSGSCPKRFPQRHGVPSVYCTPPAGDF